MAMARRAAAAGMFAAASSASARVRAASAAVRSTSTRGAVPALSFSAAMAATRALSRAASASSRDAACASQRSNQATLASEARFRPGRLHLQTCRLGIGLCRFHGGASLAEQRQGDADARAEGGRLPGRREREDGIGERRHDADPGACHLAPAAGEGDVRCGLLGGGTCRLERQFARRRLVQSRRTPAMNSNASATNVLPAARPAPVLLIPSRYHGGRAAGSGASPSAPSAEDRAFRPPRGP